ncbi:MAG: heme-binding domain-containing protein [Candidatus Kapabacteria bacterium]|nr:heme-binding domain-containing protein [Candidatus Kapabacteria bacterium]MDW8225532.1 heme-binding domain-containing protein [Bacteroidota bacterium]
MGLLLNHWKRVVFAVGALFLLLQLLPYGREFENPPVVQEPPWDSPHTRELFFRVCKDCHSNETEYPWYAWIAPASWLISHDVRRGREHFNVSEWHRPQDDAEEAAQEYRKGAMPPRLYIWLHPKASLAAEDRQGLLRGLEATFGTGRHAAIDSRESQ